MDDDARLLLAAADRLEALAARTTGGSWTIRGLLASRPEVVAESADGATEHVAEARARTAEWIRALSPALAGPLAAWLRDAARTPVDPPALAVARLLAGPVPDPDAITALYDAFDARDIDGVLAQFTPDVDWPDAWHGGRVVGRDAVRAYWLGQWEVIDSQVHPRRVRELPDGRVEVLVEQEVRDRDGDLLGRAFVLHTYTFTGPLISRMDVGDPQG
jgi:ketosteroid isomerase-like protein